MGNTGDETEITLETTGSTQTSNLTAAQVKMLAGKAQLRACDIETLTVVLENAEDALEDSSNLEEIRLYEQQIISPAKAVSLSHVAYGKLEPNKETLVIAREEYKQLLKRVNKVRGRARRLCSQGDENGSEQSSASSQGSRNASQGLMVDLPRIDLPKFSGEVCQYMTWKRKFLRCMSVAALTSSERKLLLLMQSLTGEALEVVDTGVLEEEGYEGALEALERFYGSHFKLAAEIVNAVMRLPRVAGQRAQDIQKFSMSVKTIQSLVSNFPGDLGELMLLSLLEVKLPEEIRHTFRSRYGVGIGGKDQVVPRLGDLSTFMEQLSINLPPVPKSTNRATKVHNLLAVEGEVEAEPTAVYAVTTNQEQQQGAGKVVEISCPACSSPHPVYACKLYFRMTFQEKWDLIKRFKLCANCLMTGHISRNCKRSLCKKCQGLHHTSIHLDHIVSDDGQGECKTMGEGMKDRESDGPVNKTLNHLVQSVEDPPFLMFARVFVSAEDRHKVFVRSMIDPGSERSFITSRLARRLKAQTVKTVNMSMVMIDNHCSKPRPCDLVHVEIQSKDGKFTRKIECAVIEHISDCDIYPSLSKFPYLASVDIADDSSHQDREVQMLLGAAIFPDIISGEKVEPPVGQVGPVAIKTSLGYVLSGDRSSLEEKASINSVRVNLCQRESSMTGLERFWEREELPIDPTKLTPHKDRVVWNHFKTHVVPGCPYQVSLPLDEDKFAKLGSTLSSATKRLLMLERKLARNKETLNQYHEIIDEYLSSGHAELVPVEERDKFAYFLPHRHIIKEESTSTKMRVVFDASHRSSSGLSLNDCILPCPNNSPDLFSIMVRWRCHPVAAVADVSKMYRMLQLDPSQWDLHRFLWRGQDGQIRQYRMKRLTWGTAPASFLAIAAVKHNAGRFKDKFPRAVEVICADSFVDDLLIGAGSNEEMKTLVEELQFIMEHGGFTLAKWVTPEPEVLVAIPSALWEKGAVSAIYGEKKLSALGVKWNLPSDSLTFQVKPYEKPSVLTKRHILSEIAGTFDPLGFLVAVIFRAKQLFQALWSIEGVTWDSPLQEQARDVADAFIEWRRQLPEANKFEFERCFFSCPPQQVVLHAFGDASGDGYAAVIYLVNQSEQGTILGTSYVTGKSRVAPRKALTSIPRLELCAAKLAAELAVSVSQAMPMSVQFRFWTDSLVSLAWIQKEPTTWQTFVANRVAAIQGMTRIEDWSHVAGTKNPADSASRGMNAGELTAEWFQGPRDVFGGGEFDCTVGDVKTLTVDKERRPLKTFVSLILRNVPAYTGALNPDNFRTFHSLIIVTVCAMRLANHFMKRPVQTGLFSAEEFDRATMLHVRILQGHFLVDLKEQLSRDRSKITSSYASLRPFLDEEGIVRVGGRLKRSRTIDYCQRHQIVMPKCSFMELYIREVHSRMMHTTANVVQGVVQERFWIKGCRDLVRREVAKCLHCRRFIVDPKPPLMADLPRERVENSVFPFVYTGLDFAGPFVMATRGGSAVRSNPNTSTAHICVFTCMTTRASHLEIVGDLTTRSFLLAMRRFIATRNSPKQVTSDNAQTFVGAKRILRKLYDVSDQEQLARFAVSRNFDWRFITPRAAHHGGVYESIVKLTKRHLKRSIGERIMSYDEFNTVVKEVENILNSRPIAPLDHPGETALSPALLLQGRSAQCLPEMEHVNLLTNPGPLDARSLRNRYEALSAIRTNFWVRWRSDYLNTLQRRQKWLRPVRPFRRGDVVFLCDAGVPRLKWPLAVVQEPVEGQDGQTRTIIVRTMDGRTFRRPATGLALLELDLDEAFVGKSRVVV